MNNIVIGTFDVIGCLIADDFDNKALASCFALHQHIDLSRNNWDNSVIPLSHLTDQPVVWSLLWRPVIIDIAQEYSRNFQNIFKIFVILILSPVEHNVDTLLAHCFCTVKPNVTSHDVRKHALG